MKWLASVAVTLVIAVSLHVHADERPAPEPAVSKQFSPGQVWRYKTRPGEEASRVIIGKVERLPKIGAVVHVKLVGLSLKAPGVTSSVMSHAPVSEAKVAASVTERTGEAGDLAGFQEGYDEWLSAYRAGGAGVFTLTLSEIVDLTERTLNK